MKKTYINPETIVAKVENTAMMQQLSGFNGGLNDDEGGDGGNALGKERKEDKDDNPWAEGLW